MPGAISGENAEVAHGPVASRLWIRGASPAYDFMQLLAELTAELGVHAVKPESIAEVPAFCRLLAKIAHSYAIAEHGYKSIRGALPPLIVEGELRHCQNLIGSAEKEEPPTNELHELDVRERVSDSLIVVRIRLLAKMGTPTYYVVVGNRVRDAS